MDIGKPVRIHNIPEPRREIRRFVPEPMENPFKQPEPVEQPIPAPLWPTRKREDAEVEKV